MPIVFKKKYLTANPTQILLCLVFFILSQLSAGAAERKSGDSFWSSLIKSHTSGMISKKSVIKVRFIEEVASKDLTGLKADIFVFSPSISGQGKWTSSNEATFVPDEALEPGKYQTTLKNLQDLIPVADTLKPFVFSFEVAPQSFELEVEGLKSFSSEKNNRAQQHIVGKVLTADAAEDSQIEAALKAIQNGVDLKVAWSHDHSKTVHKFVVKGIRRLEQKSLTRIYLDGTGFGVKEHEVATIPVPAAGVFKVTQAKAIQDKHNYILIRFSDSLDPKQNLKGLVHSSGHRHKFGIEGNLLKVYPQRPIKGALDIVVEPGIKNVWGKRLKTSSVHTVNFFKTPPKVRFVGKGVILPRSEQTLIPFEAVGLKSLQATAFLVYEKNIGQFLQVNGLEGNREMRRVGRFLWRKTIPLKNDSKSVGKWTRYYLDAKSLFEKHPNGLFRITLSFNRENSSYPCSESEHSAPISKERPYKNYNDIYSAEKSLWDFYEPANIQNGWRHRKNPCHEAYYDYRYRTVAKSRNFIASNIGVVAKQGENKIIHFATTDIVNGEPMSKVGVKVYNFQMELLNEVQTDDKGLALIQPKAAPFYIVAQKGNQKGYLKLNAGSALPTSHFDVGGEKISKGVKGYIYGERGVWRPGDSIYLTFVLEDKQKTLPEAHPVAMRLYTPRGRLFQSAVKTTSAMNFYSFHMKTNPSSPTGNWKAVAIVGGMRFEKKIKVETVIPNRLKVKLDFGRDTLDFSERPIKGTLFSQWLHGAPAKSLKVDVSLSFSPMNVRFKRFGDFVFEDPTRPINSRARELFKGKLNEKGHAYFSKKIQHLDNPAGMLRANFATRVFEEGGSFSKDYFSLPYHPYENYVGIKIPKGDSARGMLLTDVVHEVNVAALSADGKPASLNRVRVSLYKIKWRWWWDKSGESLARYAESSYTRSVKSDVIRVKQGMGKWTFKVKYPSWGRYLIRACDLKGKHCSGKTFYIDWPGWAGDKQQEKGVGATRLNFASDKVKYEVGETAIVRLPASAQGRALISLENGSRVLKQYWADLSGKDTRLKIPITREMSPNVYVSVTLLQPHMGKKNDRPIRLYGIIPLLVEDPETKLAPLLEAADTLSPDSETIVKVSEQNGRAMAYTIAVVDEGILGLTRYQTPNLRQEFYKRESLGVTTWDLYDEVIGAYGGKLERILALGGSGFEQQKREKEKRRFPPVAKFFGPFVLEKQASKQHRIRIPQYIGAVRIMVVAGNKKAYGSVDRTIPVKQPLMLLATMPRVLGVEEELKLPVTVFVLDKNIKEVQVSIKPDDFFIPSADLSKNVRFDSPGDKIVFFPLKTGSKQGTANIQFKAQRKKWKAVQEISLKIRNPNSKTVRSHKARVPAGQSFETVVAPHGIDGTRKMILEVSSVPPINLERHLSYLIRYPHGCVEQTTSAAFPQLYLSSLVELTKSEKIEIEQNIKAAIERIRTFQLEDGSFSYWPNSPRISDWGTTYAGHFLLEASSLGFNIPGRIMEKWKKYQYKAASLWKSGGLNSDLAQSYRLYTLALAGKPNLSAMNRLRESGNIGDIALWRLATAYDLIGQFRTREEMLKQADMKVVEYRESDNTFGSALRDKAIILQSLIQLKRMEEAQKLAEEIYSSLSEDTWRSTQTIAYSLLSLALLHGQKSDLAFRFGRIMGEEGQKTFQSNKAVIRQTFKDWPSAETKLVIHNPNVFPIYVVASAEGIPKVGQEEASSNGLELEVENINMSGGDINVEQLTQGTDFVALVKIRNPEKRDYKNLVLSYVAPSGWEIHNSRMGGPALVQDKFEHRDIRDDRVYIYFDLKAEKAKTFKVSLNASYLGKYYLPAVSVEAMYDATKNARTKGRWIKVIEN